MVPPRGEVGKEDDLANDTTDYDAADSQHFCNDGSINNLIFENHVIRTKIFEHLATSNVENVLDCRLVSKAWNQSARLVLQKKYIVKLTIIIDDIVENPNQVMNRFHYKNYRMKDLKFECMSIDISPVLHFCRKSSKANPDRDKAMLKFNQDFFEFINHPNFHALKVLNINIDYLIPIDNLLSKFCPFLEELYIQINMLWIDDEKDFDKFEALKFPKLRKLSLEFSEHLVGDLDKMSKSKYLETLLQSMSGIEELVLYNYVKLPANFEHFTNLKKISVISRGLYGVRLFNLLDFFTEFETLPKNHVESFTLVFGDVDVQETDENIKKELLHFLKKQRESLKYLTLNLTCEQYFLQHVDEEICLPKLKRSRIQYPPSIEHGCEYNLYV